MGSFLRDRLEFKGAGMRKRKNKSLVLIYLFFFFFHVFPPFSDLNLSARYEPALINKVQCDTFSEIMSSYLYYEISTLWLSVSKILRIVSQSISRHITS